ncbi:hypothetical protein CSOJ01_07935 [Colletotrichum sojae]|uniref:Uncharacterized protein n=1 Tax=Colletotrichum sojae TaxID=2175907 RepID=A0A8H6MTL1_9PEZI|nr:hypothetical protein CSOJ01_07935 [Colletotrichum sojae]
MPPGGNDHATASLQGTYTPYPPRPSQVVLWRWESNTKDSAARAANSHTAPGALPMSACPSDPRSVTKRLIPDVTCTSPPSAEAKPFERYPTDPA